MRWHSIHVHYHHPSSDNLLLDGVRPALAGVAAETHAGYFMPHWMRGPHVRVNVLAEPDAFRASVLPAISETVGRFLAASPSPATASVPSVAGLAEHRRLAELEKEQGPLVPWEPDNSIMVAEYDHRAWVWGSTTAADLQADFLSRTTDLTFEMIEHIRSGGQRLRLAFDLMAAVAEQLSGIGPPWSYRSFRSHAEAFLCAWPEGQGRRRDWDRHYRQHAVELVERLRLVAAGDARFTRRWTTMLEPYQARCQHLIETGQMSVSLGANGSSGAAESLRELSPYHAALARDRQWTQHLEQAMWFALYRLALNYTYLHLTRLGVTPTQRFLLCHLVASAAEELYTYGNRSAEVGVS